MPIRVVCDQCQSKYVIADEHAGKKVRCKKCGEICPVPSASRSSKPSASSTKKPSKPSKPKATAKVDDEYDDYGDGFDDEELISRPAPRRTKIAKKAKPEKAARSRSRRTNPLSGFRIDFTEAPTILGLPAAGALLTMLLEAVGGDDTLGLCSMGFVLVLAFILSFAGGILGIMNAFAEDALCGLMYLFLPMYSLYHTITRWDEQKKSFLMGLCAAFIFFGQGAGFIAGKALNSLLFKGGP